MNIPCDSQPIRAERFVGLHQGDRPFLLPNPWDVGTARQLAHLGFCALGTTSLGLANALGRRRASLSDILANCRDITNAVGLPVSCDLENGFGHRPEDAAEAVRAAYRHGAVGASIEDATADPSAPLYDFGHAVERVAAAASAARALPIPFVLTARAEALLHGGTDLDDIIQRLSAFAAAGADVLYAPGLRTLDQMRLVVNSVNKPINVVMGFADPSITLEQLADAGVRRVSIGGALSRLALAAFLDGASAMRAGRFDFVREIAPLSLLQAAFPDRT